MAMKATGILREEDYPSKKALIDDYNRRTERGELLRINHVSWWKQELPTEEEMSFGLSNLENNGNKVDYIVSHCCPQQIASLCGFFSSDKLTSYFDSIYEKTDFSRWFFGHYHDDKQILTKFIMLYEQIVRIV